MQDVSRAANGLSAIYVGRPTIFGNPWMAGRPSFVASEPNAYLPDRLPHGEILTPADTVDRYRSWLANSISPDMIGALAPGWRGDLLAALPRLAGHNLFCWCQPGADCHADVLLEMVARAGRRPGGR
jgi:hypothetical protein